MEWGNSQEEWEQQNEELGGLLADTNGQVIAAVTALIHDNPEEALRLLEFNKEECLLVSIGLARSLVDLMAGQINESTEDVWAHLCVHLLSQRT